MLVGGIAAKTMSGGTQVWMEFDRSGTIGVYWDQRPDA